MNEPLFWLGLSLLLVSVSLTAVLVTAIPALIELSRAARSAEKLCDTLRQELPPTLEALRLTSLEITELTDEINTGVKTATDVAKQVDQGISYASQQVKGAQSNSLRLAAGIKAAWKTWKTPLEQ
ncbi:hypothetical protein [Gloeocapsa sp. PCC 73106]|uniref:hypothetical protein n=1 Tax=Gloeocapsa sp. PCC 73106 TaxID=102232 RepID=UPI0002AD145E|nr:hypothetical protein [Gloeocapsa sp. PCC 73106]ELR97529.1 hypothetical protein GLO73106DRAFT_00013390 [Gloeocapsa sp. PCC 73106]